MASPTIRASVAPVTGLTGTSPSGTQVGDLVVCVLWERAGAGVPTHTLQSNFIEAVTVSHDDGSTDGRLSIAGKVATSSGSQSYQPYTSSTGSPDAWIGIVVITAGTFDSTTPFSAAGGASAATGASATSNAAPNPPATGTLTNQRDWLSLAVAAWHLGSAATVTVTNPSGYSNVWDISGSATSELACASLALTAPDAAENPAAFADNVAPNGTVCATVPIVEARKGDVNNDQSGGTDGTTLTVANSGGASGTKYFAVAVNASGTLTYEDEPFLEDAAAGLGIRVDPVSSQKNFEFDAAGCWGEDKATVYTRFYLYMPDLPAATVIIHRLRDNPLNTLMTLRVGTDGTLSVFDSGNTLSDTLETVLAADTLYRIECKWTTSQVIVRLYDSPDAAVGSFVEEETVADTFGSADAQYVSWGHLATTGTGPFYVKNTGIAYDDWLGPLGTFESGTQFNQSVPAGMTGTVAIARTAQTTKALGAALAAAVARATSTARAIGMTGAPSASRRTATARALGMTGTVAVASVKVFLKLVDAAMTGTAAVVRQAGKSIAATLTGGPAVSRATSTARALGATLSAAVVKQTFTARALGAALAVAVVRQTRKVVDRTSTMTAAVQRSTSKMTQIAATLAPAVTRMTATARAVGSAFAAAVQTSFQGGGGETFPHQVDVSMTAGVVIARQTGHLVGATAAYAVALARQTAHGVAATLTGAAGLVRTTARTLGAGLSAGAQATKETRTSRAVASAFAAVAQAVLNAAGPMYDIVQRVVGRFASSRARGRHGPQNIDADYDDHQGV